MDRGDYRSAVIELRNALQVNPSLPKARYLLARASIELGDPASAEKEVRVALKLGIPRQTGQPLLVRSHLLQGDYEAVIAESSEPDPALSPSDQARVLSYRAEALVELERFAEAEEQLKAAEKLDAEVAEVPIAKAIHYVHQGKLASAEEFLVRAVELDSDNPRAWSLLGQIRLMRGDYAAAEEAFTRAIDLHAYITLDMARRAHARIFLEKFDKAEGDIESVKSQGLRDNAYVNYVAGVGQFKQGKYSAALESLQLSARDGRPWLPRLGYLAATHLELGNREQALRHAQRAAGLAPQSFKARRLLGIAQVNSGEYESAQAVLQAALADSPDDPIVLDLLGTLAMQTGDMDGATNYYQRLSELRPGSSRVDSNLMLAKLIAGDSLDEGLSEPSEGDGDDYTRAFLKALASFRDGKPQEALEQAKTLSAKHPDKVAPLNLIAAVHIVQGRPEQAKTTLRHVLSIRPEEPSATRNLAFLLWKGGEPERARELLSGFVANDPGNENIVLLLAQIETELGHTEEKRRLLENALDRSPDSTGVRAELARMYLKNGEIQRVLEITNELSTQQEIAYPALLEARGKAQLWVGDKSAAQRSFQRWTAVAPNSAPAHFFYAESAAASNDLLRAESQIDIAIELDKSYLPARLGKIKLLGQRGDMVEARRSLAKLKNEFGDQVPVLSLEGWLAMKGGDYSAAADAYQAASEQAQDTELTILWFRSLWGQTKHDAALQVLQDWLGRHPRDLAVLKQLAEANLALGRQDKATAVYTEALQYYPNHVPILNNIAWLNRENDLEKAIGYSETAYQVAPEDPFVLDTYGMLLMQKGEVTRGAELISRAADKLPDNAPIQLHRGQALLRQQRYEEARRRLTALAKKTEDPEVAREARALMQSIPAAEE